MQEMIAVRLARLRQGCYAASMARKSTPKRPAKPKPPAKRGAFVRIRADYMALAEEWAEQDRRPATAMLTIILEDAIAARLRAAKSA
jgi:hypothetical protein